MADQTLTCMIPPTLGITYNTIDATPYRSDPDGFVYVKSQHIAEMTARGFVAATLTQVGVTAAGDTLVLDQGWVAST